jgi:hypothetical protein
LGVANLGLGYVVHNAGGHVSLLRVENEEPLVTAEMQAQVVTFVLQNGSVAIGSQAPTKIELPAL